MDLYTPFITNLLLKITNNRSDRNARDYYWNCIKQLGYSKDVISNPYMDSRPDSDSDPDSDTEPQGYDAFQQYDSDDEPVPGLNAKRVSNYYSPGEISYSESQHLNRQTERTTRTFIQPGDNSLINKLSELNKWTSVTSKDTEIKKINDIIDFALDNLIENQDYINIQRLAINMYYNILEYYSTNDLGLKVNKGNIKKGYIVLVIYYALMYFKMNPVLEQIVSVVPDARLNYVPEARDSLHKIFEGVENYSFIFKIPEQNYVTTLCNLEKLLPQAALSRIANLKKRLISSNIFPAPLSGIQIAACIYFVTSLPISKGGISQKRLTVDIDGTKHNITLELLATNCGPSFSAATLSKNVTIVSQFYQKIKNS